MPIGKGKYNSALTEALKGLEAKQGVLLVLDGEDGAGFSVQADLPNMIALPATLERIAMAIRADLVDLGKPE